MRSLLRILLVLLFLGGRYAAAQEILFVEGSIDEVLEEAGKEGKPVFVDFFATWCGPCKAMESEVFSCPEVASYYNERFVCYQVDVDKERKLMQKYNVTSMPTSIFLNSEGKELRRIVGVVPADRLLHVGQEVTGERKPYPELYKEYQGNKSDLDLARELLLEAPSHVREAGKAAALWQKRAFELFGEYLTARGLADMVTAEDFRVLVLYQQELERGDSVLNFVNAHVKEYERVVENPQMVWEYIISRQNSLVNALAIAGDTAYRQEIERVEGDMAYVYSQIKSPNLTVREALQLQADGNYALYAEKDEAKYLDMQDAYFERLGDRVSFADYQNAITVLVKARNGRLKDSSCERCIDWLVKAAQINLQPREQLDRLCLLGSCYHDLEELENAKGCFNQAFVLAMQLNDQQAQMQIRAMLNQLSLE